MRHGLNRSGDRALNSAIHTIALARTGHGRKSDEADAYSVGVAALTAHRLNATATDDAVAALGALTEHRDDLVRTRTQTANRIHTLLTQIIPAGRPRGLTADDAAQTLRRVRPRTTLGRTLRQLAVELVGELRRLDRRTAAVSQQLSDAVAAVGGRQAARPNRPDQPVPLSRRIRLLRRGRPD
jgi:hypothetical protein